MIFELCTENKMLLLNLLYLLEKPKIHSQAITVNNFIHDLMIY